MVKNVFNPNTLLLIVTLLVFSACAGSKNISYHSQRKAKKERKARSYSRANTSTTEYKRASVNTPSSISTKNKRVQIVSTAKKYIGKPYKYGGKKASTGFDCSGFTSQVFTENGVKVTGPSYVQAKKGKKITQNELKKGDLVFFGSNNKVSHVGIVASISSGNIDVIHSTSSRGVVVDNISGSDYWQKRFLFGRDVVE